MFGLSRLTLILIASGFVVATIYAKGYFHGKDVVQKDWDKERAKIAQERLEWKTHIQSIQEQMQDKSNAIYRSKQNEINAINRANAALVAELQQRPARQTGMPQDAGTNQIGCDGSKLYREDAEFLAGEAAAADKLQSALKSCYQQYDSIKELMDSQ